MIEELLPDEVVAVEVHGDDGSEPAPLYPEEAEVVAQAVDKRRREFALVRACARRAMDKLGVPPQPVLPGERGAPHWPHGLAGSMTHCDGYAAAALVRATDVASLGIDAEPHQPLPEGVLEAVSLPAEGARLRRLAAQHPGIHWDRLLFSAKESVYKAWFPLTRQWLEFTEADIEMSVGPGEPLHGRFRAQLLVPGPLVGGRRLGHFEGRWTVQRGLVATAITVPHTP
ncbi:MULTISPECIES: 4'-phosphopantetheinyl transferase family protein [unclassified Streptomyces]|uniref:4'-phosphopantetheinyl transferase family protein n=1 Tax=unclassified Streptomyces TaxID=2593676 RepID=UPI002259694D|nr:MULTISPECIES: 4'-phosphopantetheinyl transferase superfamily protein [unclassified Streptomyces]MCX5052880.1 4'-phosphopantetheinyl transferase superfamily protein [Streptomyces sp. NBC_00474]MCX5062703.1 4'-phosphopantetheinyl transferase superfamily protein [Streptomyces sp. NBC_00452]MCX5250383.1 4'-phosphopantetheinyl transferase superfamily protein [Streptomyces sp. NBC_00201]MCX5291689.1 4'-phosphopantetheinyl transferase superfamily protein [Streptomyces sp. NBC_00183]